MEDLLTLIVSNIVSKPDKVQIDSEESESTITFTISADKDDLGKIIGKNGKTIQAIRTLVKTLAAQEHLWVSIDVVEA